MLGVSANLTQTVFLYLYLCICIVYLHVKHLGTLFLRSWYHILFQKCSTCWVYLQIWPNCIRVFVYLYLCIWFFKTFMRPNWPKNADPFSSIFLSSALNWLKSVKRVFPLILLIFNFSTKQLWCHNLPKCKYDHFWKNMITLDTEILIPPGRTSWLALWVDVTFLLCCIVPKRGSSKKKTEFFLTLSEMSGTPPLLGQLFQKKNMVYFAF